MGAVALILIFITLPSKFPHSQKPSFNVQSIRRVDYLGTLLLLAASILLVSALELGDTERSWRRSLVLSLFILSISLWICFAVWERYQGRRETAQESVFPWRLATSRFSVATLLYSFLSGAALFSVIIYLPLNFQVTNGMTPFQAGYHLLVLTLCTPLGSGVAGLLMQRFEIPPLYLLIVGGSIQTIGVALMTTLPVGQKAIPAAQYGYNAVMGVGFGMGIGTTVMMAPLVFDKRDMGMSSNTIVYPQELS